jgi:tRNA nucleotidyltransferase (CCA-adding enzyme)
MDDMDQVESDVLKRVKPSPEEDGRVASAVSELEARVAEEAGALDATVETMLVGSVAKGTHLKDPDIDLFMLFPESTPMDELRETGLDIGKRVLGGREHYAQHPYIRGEHRGFQVDLVPCFKIHDTLRKMSAVDRTPFHTEFIKANLGEGARDQVRLLKRFMKGVGCYGAEAKVQGFSGYLCELLVIRYGGFREVLSAVVGWRLGERLELPGHGSEREFPESLVFVDPVDGQRNVASAVSPESMLRLVRASREYLASPGTYFFFPKERPVWTAKEVSEAAGDRLGNMLCLSFDAPDLVDDVLYPQLRKTVSAMVAALERAEFEVEKTTFQVSDGRAHLLVELASMTLPEERVHRGPPEDSENVHEFVTKWRSQGVSQPYTERGRWFVVARREFVRGDELLRARMDSLSIGKDIRAVDDLDVGSGESLLGEELLETMTVHLDERMPWER